MEYWSIDLKLWERLSSRDISAFYSMLYAYRILATGYWLLLLILAPYALCLMPRFY